MINIIRKNRVSIMEQKKVAYFLMTLSFIMIFSGGVSSFVKGLKDDHQATYNRLQVVNDEFEIFSANTSIFEEYRDDLYNKVLSNVYYDTMYEQDIDVKMKLTSYEKLVDQISDNVAKLNALCSNMIFPNGEANSRCSNYKSIYEQVVNYFVGDIKVYNDNVSKYNEYQKNIGNKLSIKKYRTNKKYIDYNEDGNYDGKEE